jgi:hypothetical protein
MKTHLTAKEQLIVDAVEVAVATGKPPWEFTKSRIIERGLKMTPQAATFLGSTIHNIHRKKEIGEFPL